MNIQKKLISNFTTGFLSIILLLILPCCTDSSKNIVEVSSSGMNFQLPAEIPSGWTTFEYQNNSDQTHFFVLQKMPMYNGRQLTVKDSREKVVPVFQESMNLINEGKVEEGYAGFAKLPEWFKDIKFLGGPGFIAPGKTTQTTLFIEPGTYTLECYVKSPEGIFHSAMGMTAGLVVTNEPSEIKSPPKPTIELNISADGIEVPAKLKSGKHIVAIHFKDQKVHEHFIGHDVNLARLEGGTNVEALAKWVNWSEVEGLRTPAPAEFLGGSQEMPAGSTAYFHVDLEPGRYAWIAEVPDPASKGMFKISTVE